jgi:hypothetical protein
MNGVWSGAPWLYPGADRSPGLAIASVIAATMSRTSALATTGAQPRRPMDERLATKAIKELATTGAIGTVARSDAVTRSSQSHSRRRSRGDGECGPSPLARYRLAPRPREIAFGRHMLRSTYGDLWCADTYVALGCGGV